MQQLTFEVVEDHWFGWRVDGRNYIVERFARDDAQLLARLLQGWIPVGLGLDRVTRVEHGTRFGQWVGVRPVTKVLVVLPGGSRPEVDYESCDRLYSDDGYLDRAGGSGSSGVSVAGTSEGRDVLLADISFSRSRVFWEITLGSDAGARWEFGRAQYDAALRGLLELLGEEPVLISDEEWAASPVTRVVPI